LYKLTSFFLFLTSGFSVLILNTSVKDAEVGLSCAVKGAGRDEKSSQLTFIITFMHHIVYLLLYQVVTGCKRYCITEIEIFCAFTFSSCVLVSYYMISKLSVGKLNLIYCGNVLTIFIYNHSHTLWSVMNGTLTMCR